MSAIPIPSFPPYNMKILPSGFQSVKSLQKNPENQICKNKRQISLSVHPFVKQKLCSPFVRFLIPGGQKVQKGDRRSPRCIKKGPQRASKTEDATNTIQRWSPKGALGPQRRSRGPRSNFWLFESLLWEPLWERHGEPICIEKTMFFAYFRALKRT